MSLNQFSKEIIINEKFYDSFNEEECPLLKLPDYIIVGYIFPYISWKELFFNMRRTNTYLHNIIKDNWANVIKEEMCNQLKNLAFIYEKDALSKTYEFKLHYLVNYRNILQSYSNNNINIISVLKNCINLVTQDDIFKLIATLLGILGQEELLNILFDESKEINLRENILKEKLETQLMNDDIKLKINIILDINSIESDSVILSELKSDFQSINFNLIENFGDECRLIYSYLQGIFEYQELKKDVQELKKKINELYNKIQNETKIWPKTKKFFETAYKILLYTKTTNPKFKYIYKLFLKNNVRSPFCEFKEESYKTMLELKKMMETKKQQILLRLTNNNLNNNNSTENVMDEINQILFDNLIKRRTLLTNKIILTEKFYNLFILHHLDNEEDYCEINGTKIEIKEFLKLLLITNAYSENISDENLVKVFQIKEKIEKNEEKIKESKNIILQNEILELEKKKAIEILKKQREKLINQKKKTEQMLNIIKKYIVLKNNFLNNKEKYKPLLYVLSKLKNNNSENDEYDKPPSLDRLEEILQNDNIENFKFNEDEISQKEIEKIKNFEINETLLKEIENSLLKKINDYFKEEKEMSKLLQKVTQKTLNNEND